MSATRKQVLGFHWTDCYECDGPNHVGDRELTTVIPIIVSHGYGSPFDGKRHVFCNGKCFREWVNENEFDD